jgi:hypothetical protein
MTINSDFTTILKDAPIDEWLALSSSCDRIVASSTDIEEAVALARDRGEDNAVMMKAPRPGFLVL